MTTGNNRDLATTHSRPLDLGPSGKRGPLGEVGVTGLNAYSGTIQEEFLVELRGQSGRRIFEEMRSNDPVVGALLFAIEMPIREVEWTVQPGEDTPQGREIADFVKSCMSDMSLPWADYISQILTMLPFGYSVFEKVYKRRNGRRADPISKFNDGRIGWRKMAFRAQDTVYRWVFDDTGGLQGFVQQAPPDFRQIPLPIEKLVLYRTRNEKGNPEGRSVLRTAYRAWYFKKTLEQLEAIALERTGVGFPVIYMPQNADNNDSGNGKDQVAARDLVRKIRLDEQQGVTLPGPKGGEGVDGWLLEFIGTGNARGVGQGFHEAIIRYRQEMLMSVMASFIALGTDKVGSNALSRDQRDFFQVAIEGWVKSMEETFNRFMVPELVGLNWPSVEEMPTIDHTPLGQVNMESISTLLTAAGNMGFLSPSPDIEAWLRQVAGMPEMSDDEREALEIDRDDETMNDIDQFLQGMGRQQGLDPAALEQAQNLVKRIKGYQEFSKRNLHAPQIDDYAWELEEQMRKAQNPQQDLSAETIRGIVREELDDVAKGVQLEQDATPGKAGAKRTRAKAGKA